MKPTLPTCLTRQLMTRLLLFTLLLMGIGQMRGFAQEIFHYTNDTGGAHNYIDPNADFVPPVLGRGAGVSSANLGCAGPMQGFGATHWPTTNVFNVNTFNSDGEYITLTLTPDAGFGLKITGFSAKSRRENLTGTADDGPIGIRYGYSTNGPAGPWTTVNPGNPQSSNLCASGGVNRVWPAWNDTLTSNPIIFRIYGLSSGSNFTGDLFLREVIVNGEVCANEPSIALVDNSLQVCSGVTSTTLAYSAEDADSVSINYDGIAEAQGFVDVATTLLASAPNSIAITVPAGATPNIIPYNGTLRVKNVCGFYTDYPFTVEVWALPTAVLSGDQTICAGDEAPLNVTLTGSPDWDFELSEGSMYSGIGIPEPVLGGLYPASTIVYTIVSLTDGNGCVAIPAGLTGSATVTVNPLPDASVSLSALAICDDGSVTLTFTDNGATGHLFTIIADLVDDNGTTVGAINYSNIPSGAFDTYTEGVDFEGSTGNSVSLTNIVVTDETTGCDVALADLVVTINPIPDGAATSKSICSATATALDVSELNGVVGSTFNWTASYGAVTGGAGSATGVSFGVTAINETLVNPTNAPIVVTYTIQAIGPAPTYCADSFFDVFITVEPAPIFGFSASTTSNLPEDGDNDPNTLTPNSICVDFCAGDLLTLNGYSDNGNIGYTVVYTTTGNVTYDGGPALPLIGVPSNVSPAAAAGFFGTTYGGALGYGLSSGTYGVIDQRFVPYLDVDGSGTLTPGDCEGELVQLLYKIYAPIVVNVVRNDNNLCSGEQVDYTISTTSTQNVLFDLTLSENTNAANPADLDDDNILPIQLLALSLTSVAPYHYTQAINNALGTFDRGRVLLTISNVRYADSDVSCGTTINNPNSNTLIYPKPRLNDPSDKFICTGSSSNLDLDLLGLPSSNPANAGNPVRIEWTAVGTNVVVAPNGVVNIYDNAGLEIAVNDITEVLTLSNPLLNGSVTYTITPRASGPTNAFNGDDCFGDPITVTITVVAPANPTIEGPDCVHDGAQIQLTGTPNVNLPATLDSESWLSSNPAIATVDGTGLVTGESPGSATISYTVTDDAGCVTTANYVIEVLEPLLLEHIYTGGPVACGEEFTVSVDVTNFCDINTMDYLFDWDITAFQLVSFNTPYVPSDGSFFAFPNGPNELQLSFADNGFPPYGVDVPDGTVVFTYTLRAIGSLGAYNIPEGTPSAEAYNSNFLSVPMSTDGVSIPIEILSLNLLGNPEVCPSDDNAFLLFNNVVGNPNHYLIDFLGCPLFPNTQEGALIVMDGQIVIPLPDGLQNGACNATLVISNTIYGCESDEIPFSIIIDQEEPTVPTPDPISQQCFPAPAPDINVVVGEDDNCTDPEELVVAYEPGLTTDNGGAGCSGDPLIIYRVYSVTDEAGNTTYVTQTITIEDTGFPTVETDLPNTWYPSLDDAEDAALARAYETRMDNCTPDVGINVTFATVSTFVGCTWTIHLAVTDACGNLTLANYTTVVDDEDPNIGDPDPLDDCYGESEDPEAEHYPYQDAVDAAIAAVTAVANDNCTDPEDLVITATTSGTDCDLDITVTVADGCGRTATYTYNTRVESDAPYISTSPDALNGLCYPTQAEAEAAAIAATVALDDCLGGILISVDQVSEGCPAEITVSVTDYCGNPSYITYTGVYIDTGIEEAIEGSPETTCFQTLDAAAEYLAGITLLSDDCSTVEELIASALDPEGEFPPSFTPGEVPCEGTVTLTFTDHCGNSTVAEYAGITIDDEDPVVVSLPTVDPQYYCMEEVPAGDPGSVVTTDNCGPVVVTWNEEEDMLPDGCPGLLIRTYHVIDCAGNTVDVTQSILVNDDVSPTFPEQPVLEIACPCGDLECLDSANDLFPEAEDNCGEVELIKTSGLFVPSLDCPQAGTYTNTWTAYDDCGNPSETVFTQVITVYDNVFPDVNFGCMFAPLELFTSDGADCPSDATISLEVGQVIHPNDTWFVAGVEIPSLTGCVSDNCATDEYINIEVVSIDYDYELLDCALGITITFEISDACGNANPMPFVCEYIIIDDVAPTWDTPEGEPFPTGINLTIACDDVAGYLFANSLAPTASDECSDVDLIKITGGFVAGGDCPQEGTFTNTWVAYDDCLNPSVMFTQVITVIDNAGPTWITLPEALNMTVSCGDGYELDYAQTFFPVAEDNCDGTLTPVKTWGSLVPGICPGTGTIINTWTVTDDCGNISTAYTQVITIIDDTAPTLFCVMASPTLPDDCYETEEDAEAAALAVVSGFPFCIEDECTPYEDLLIVASTSGDPCEAVVTVTVTDCAENSASYAFNTRIDGTPPTMTPGSIPLCFLEQGDAEAYAFSHTTISDNCSNIVDMDVDIITSPSFPASQCPATITIIVTDECGNSNSVSYPGICIGSGSSLEITNEADNLNVDCDGWAIDLQAWLADNGGAEATGSGVMWSYSPLDPQTALEMSAPNCTTHTKSVLVTFIATDGCGYTDSSTATFSVTDNTPPTANPIANTNLTCSTGIPAPNVAIVTGEADNCGGTLTVAVYFTSDNYNPMMGTGLGCPGDPRIIIHQYIVTDAYCNTALVNHMITVVDNVPPNFTAPANITINVDGDCEYNASSGITGDVTNESDNCTPSGPSLQAYYTDMVANGPLGQNPKYIITRTWNLTDACGNSAIQRVQTITVQDLINPTITGCPANNSHPGGSVVVDLITYTCAWTATALAIPIYSDNCPMPVLSYHLDGFFVGSADGMGNIGGRVFLEGVTTVTYTVTDCVGNTATCSFTVTVNCITIAGRIIWEHDGTSGVKDATVNVTSVAPPFSGSDLSDTNGDYDVTVTIPNITYKVKPVKNTGGNEGRMNGVDAADATRITNHVNFTDPITNPYKKVCADVNRSSIINTQDATLITQCIAGNPTAQAVFNVFWRFVPTDFMMPPTAHQNVPVFPDFKNVPVTTLDVIAVNFYGMKIGDVEADWANPQAAPNLAPLVWVIQDQTLVAGTEVELTFAASNFNDLASYQFALDFDPAQLKFVGFQPLGAIPMNLLDNFGAYNADLGELRNVWATGPGITLAEGTAVFRAKFKVLESGQKLSQVLKLDDSQIACKAYNEALIPTDVKLVFTESVGANTPLDFGHLQLQLMQNRPNPFTDATTIGFILPEACEAHIRILDISGRELTSYDRDYTAGYHELEFRMENAWSYGVLFCELVTPQGKRTIKMMTAK